jgi:hypothetical protein
MKRGIAMKKSVALSTMIILLILAGQTALAGQGPPPAPVGQTAFSFSATALHQFDTDLEGGGDYSVQRYLFRFDARRQMTPDLNGGIGLAYDYENWDFSGATGFRRVPWGDIHRTGVDLSLQYSGIEDWTLFLLPGLSSARESGAEWQDSLQAGGVAAASYRFSNQLTLGVGAGLYTGLEETRGFPFLVVRWRISDHLMLANPFRPGPTGPAGLELIYTIDENWTIAAGSAWRSFRFRLDDGGPAPEGIGEVETVPVWGRLTRRIADRWVVDLYAGYALDGELKLEDRRGNEVGSVDQDAAPFAAFTVVFRF